MHRILAFLLFFLCYLSGFSQTIVLKGKVTDNQEFPLEAATVYLTTVKDSAIIDYTITGKGGTWEIKTKKIEAPVFIKVSYLGLGNYKKEYPLLAKDQDFGSIKLDDKSTELGEVVIESEIPPIRIKKDTLEFNASSFKVRPDATVEALLKQLPGVNIDADGKITVNGKEVNQILVNGKPFFDTNGQIAIKNLPAEIIDKVQVSDTKTRKEELAGQKASGDNSSINLTIKKDRNKGYFGKLMGGYGSDKRYESSAFVNYFKNKMKISVLASSNNINSSGFSMNELFDSMGSGRNSTLSAFSGGGRGITKSDLAGLNYADEWFKGFDASASYSLKNSNTENNNRTNSTNFLPEGDDPDNPGTNIDKSYRTNSTSRSEADRISHDFNTDFKLKIDSTATLRVTPKFSVANSKTSTSSNSYSERLIDDRLMNESTASSESESDSKTFSNELNYYKALNSKKGRGISVTLSNSNGTDDESNLNRSNTKKYKYPGADTVVETEDRDQIIYNNDSADSYSLGFEYSEPVTDSLALDLSASYTKNKSVQNRDTYDFDAVSGGYTAYNDSLSNYYTSNTGTVSPRVGIRTNKSKINFNASFGTDITSFNNNAFFVDRNYIFDRKYIVPAANAGLYYRVDKGKSISAGYNYAAGYPQANQVITIPDRSNPLNTFIGNPDLKTTGTHTVRASYRNYNTASRSGLSIIANTTFFQDRIVSYTSTNSSGENTISYRNVSGAMSSNFYTYWNKDIKRDANLYRVVLGLSAGYSIDKGFLNTQLYDSKSVRLNPSLSFTYEYGELLTINPNYNFTYNQYNYNNYTVSSRSNYVHRLSLQTTSYWPKHVVFGNDFGYTYNSNITGNFKKDFYLWNTSIGYNFLKDELLFKVKVYDVLNQNLGTSRTIDATSIVDQENTVLKMYVMFSLTYKFGEFGGGKNRDRQRDRPMGPSGGMGRGRRN
ncbi:outer membrane beta-barrel protein [Flavobacterium sp. DG1-102-2]|uniref:outer membrane beta-barrel protein n=1 Tax=Flavobacterium sp. DG1-102-2 TaxID=3081663 RepID=UPI0029493D90|nr:outer membrane beta-barrel protein [Flavobacterium sp. DG1-102-2]MDV6168797.1 outer membrane beta-barrel protein [Flavobacterium sp. DG1-102-2]